MLAKDLKPWVMFGLALIFYAYESMLRVSPSVMSHELIKDFNVSAAGLSHLAAYYYYIYTPMQLLVGMLMDRYGPRVLLSTAALTCTCGTFVFGSTSKLGYAEFGRFLMGLGSSFAFVGVLKLAANWLPKNRIAIAAGITMAVGMVGGFFCDTVLPEWVQSYGWRSTSIGSAWFGVALSCALFVFLRDKTQAPKARLADSMQGVFENMLSIIKDGNMWLSGTIGCMMWLPIAIYAETWGVGYLMDVKGYTHSQVAAVNSWVFIGWAVGGPMLGYLSDYYRRRKLLLSLGSLVSGILFILFFMLDLQPLYMGVILFLAGVAGSTQVLVFAVSRDNTPSVASGSAAAFTNLLVMMAGVIQPISGIVMDLMNTSNVAHEYSVSAYNYAMALVPAALIISCVLSLFIRDKLVKQAAKS